MTDEPLNNELRERIGQVFDQFEAPEGAAEAGWTELRKVYPPQKKRRAAAGWWSAAAVLLALLVLGIWMYPSPVPEKPEYTKSRASKTEAVPDRIKTVRPVQASGVQPLATQSTQAGEPELPKHAWSGYHQAVKANKNTEITPGTDKSLALAGTTPGKVNPGGTNTSRAGNPVNQAPGISATDTAATLAATPLSARQTEKKDTAAQKAPATMAQVFAREAAARKNSEVKEEKKADKRLNLSVYAGTYVSYASGSNNQINAAAGVLSDIRLARRIKLVTGVAIGQNSLSYNGQPAQPGNYAIAQAAIAKSTPATLNINNATLPYFTAVNRITGYNASFTGLDIPLNLKYELSTGRNESYLMAGVSSGTFINENYTYSYTNLNSAATQSAALQNRFGTFNFARTLNVAFGLGTPLGKRNQLIVEPFLKYPIGGLGTQQLRFGSGGINLKFNLLSDKK